jgi:FkbM family methyltransferase
VRFTVNDEVGQPIEFECPDTLASRWTCGAILEGRTYPHVPFASDVHTVLDVGANCGAMTVHLARHHPDATIHAFEPGREARGYLERNTSAFPNVSVHPFGLYSTDQDAQLFITADDIGQASIIAPEANAEATAEPEPVRLRSAAGWAAENHIDRIDILKIDVEGCEVEVLESLVPLLPTVQVLYVEYDSRRARRELEHLLASTHELYLAMMMALDQGECLYVRKDLADHPDARERLRTIFTRPR